jgi:putative ABC transport system substrate-binding protein
MDRRAFLGTLAGGFLAAPLAAEAQQAGSTPKLGYLSNSGGHSVPDNAFMQGLRDLGYVEGRNLIIEARYTDGRSERFSEFAADLVRRGVQVIAAWSPAGVAAAKRATDTVPIIGIAMGSDPVGLGWIASLARPNSNVTGLTSGNVWLSGKRMELLQEAFPTITRVGVLANPTNPFFPAQAKEAETVAHSLKIQVESLAVSSPAGLATVLPEMKKRHMSALLVMPDGMLWARRADIVKMAAEGRMPAMYWTSDYTEAGGLMSYAESLNDLGGRAAGYVDKILKGAKPADLPVEQPQKFELIINLNTAKALGLTIPPSLLQRADQVIE